VTICAFIGWVTNVVAVKMIFRPHQRVRILGPIGWQGVVARHAHRFARDVAEMITRELLAPRDLAVQIDPAPLRRTLDPLLLPAVDTQFARFVDELPATVRQSGMVGDDILAIVRKQLFDEVDRLIVEVRDLTAERIDALVDLRSEIARNLTEGGSARLEDLILTVAGREFRWIEYYGGILGGVLGFVAVGLRTLGLTSLALLPAMGVATGLVTNWIAILMLFSPRHPVRVGMLTLQGAFARRQHDIAATLATVLERELMKFGEMLDLLDDLGGTHKRSLFSVEELGEQPRRHVPPYVVPLRGCEALPHGRAVDRDEGIRQTEGIVRIDLALPVDPPPGIHCPSLPFW
jgi:uncharacterized membrane protein YheB (UPF0754 family)